MPVFLGFTQIWGKTGGKTKIEGGKSCYIPWYNWADFIDSSTIWVSGIYRFIFTHQGQQVSTQSLLCPTYKEHNWAIPEFMAHPLPKEYMGFTNYSLLLWEFPSFYLFFIFNMWEFPQISHFFATRYGKTWEFTNFSLKNYKPLKKTRNLKPENSQFFNKKGMSS